MFQMNEDGEINWEVARSKMPASVSQEEADQIYNACKDISKYNINRQEQRSIFIRLEN